MSIEDVAERTDVWAEALKKIIKAVTAAAVAIIAAVSGLMMMWPSNDEPHLRCVLIWFLVMGRNVLSCIIRLSILGQKRSGLFGSNYGKI